MHIPTKGGICTLDASVLSPLGVISVTSYECYSSRVGRYDNDEYFSTACNSILIIVAVKGAIRIAI